MAKYISYRAITITLLIIFCIALLIFNGNKDFWYDEYYTIHHSVFCPVNEIVQEYKSLNIHLGLAIMCHLILDIERININDLLDKPLWLRLPLILFPILTIIFLWKIGNENYNGMVGLIAVLVLITTIPYYHYALQIRGYSMSIALMTMILYFVFSNKNNVVMLTLLPALFCYTMFSNGAFLVVLIGYLLITKNNKWRYILVGIAVSMIISIPTIKGILNDGMANNGLFYLAKDTLINTSKEMWIGFVSYRWMIFPLIVVALWNNINGKLLLYIGMLIIPILLFAIQGSKTYGRFMLPALPCFCLLVASGFDRIIGIIEGKE